MPMNPRLLRPIASGVHPEANAWRTAVVANGGSVSASTMKAVSKFCGDIDAAGIRDRFYRLNLFCGTGLNAALVPVYRGQSRTGTQYGNTTDTNQGPFVSGDYSETGASGGLKGNGTSKYLDTGVTPADIASLNSFHLAYSGTSLETTSSPDKFGIGSYDGVAAELFDLSVSANYGLGANRRGTRIASFTLADFSATGRTEESLIIGTRTSSSLKTLYAGGTSVATNTSAVTPASSARTFHVFALNIEGTASVFTAGRFRQYSIGNGLTAQQVTDFTNAVSAFNTALGRA